jgi:hypothetical protein
MVGMSVTRRLLPLGLCALAVVGLSSCTPPNVDLAKVLQVTDVSTGYFDAGIVEGNKNKIVPTISVRLKNVGTQPVSSVQVIAKFSRIGEAEEWGSAPYVVAIGPEGLQPGQTGNPIVMKCDRGYTGEQPRAELFHHSQFVDVHVELFGKHAAQNWVKLGDYKIARILLEH